MALVRKRRIGAKQVSNHLNDCFSFSHIFKAKHRNDSQLNSCLSKIKSQSNRQFKDYKLFCDPKWMEKFLNGEVESHYYSSEKSHNLVDFVTSRSIDNRGIRKAELSEMFATRHLISNDLLREHVFDCVSFNKVFSSQWLNEQQVIFGTKCNQLIVLNVLNQKQHKIPTLKSSCKTMEAENPCGIHSIQINPSQTLLATGGQNPNDVAVYRLPTLDPFCVGEGAHSDWIFDMTWLDDQFLISGSRDSTLALWRFDENNESLKQMTDLSIPVYGHRQSLVTKVCRNAEKIRALLYNKRQEEVVVLSLNAKIHLFDCKTLRQKLPSIDLPFQMENVCLSQQSDANLYAVGSKSNVTLLDAKTLKPINKILSKSQGSGIRSLSFHDQLLTIGTGYGTVLFYDIRANKYLDSVRNDTKEYSHLKASKGYVFPEELFSDLYFQLEYTPAIYTHQYDASKTRLFAAGGPLPANLQGSYAGLWA